MQQRCDWVALVLYDWAGHVAEAGEAVAVGGGRHRQKDSNHAARQVLYWLQSGREILSRLAYCCSCSLVASQVRWVPTHSQATQCCAVDVQVTVAQIKSL